MDAFRRNLTAIYAIWLRDVLRFSRDRARIVGSMGQPLLFLFVFGTGLAPAMSGTEGGALDFRQFIFPGVLAMAVLFTAMFSAVSIVWDRQFGFLKEVLVTPVSRAAVALGKVAGGATVALFQGLLVLLIGPLVGVRQAWPQVIVLVGLMLLFATVMTALGMAIAARQRTMESFHLITQFALMPMFFLSGAFFPLREVPSWMTWINAINPLSYGVDSLRHEALRHSVPDAALALVTVHPLSVDVAMMSTLALGFIAVAVWQFGRQE